MIRFTAGIIQALLLALESGVIPEVLAMPSYSTRVSCM